MYREDKDSGGRSGLIQKAGANKSIVALITLIMVLASLSMIITPGKAETTADTDGEIYIKTFVHDEGEPIEDATIDIFNGSDNLVDSAQTDSDGEAVFMISQNLENSTIEIYESSDAEVHELDINLTLPANSNETTYEYYSIDLGTDYSETAENSLRENPYIVAGGGILIVVVIVVGITKSDEIDEPW